MCTDIGQYRHERFEYRLSVNSGMSLKDARFIYTDISVRARLLVYRPNILGHFQLIENVFLWYISPLFLSVMTVIFVK